MSQWTPLLEVLGRARARGYAAGEPAHPPAKIVFLTSRLSNDGVAAVTEFQARELTNTGYETLFVTGATTDLWSGTTAVRKVRGLAIPDTLTESVLLSGTSKDLVAQITERAQAISRELEALLIAERADCLIVQNLCSLPYNIPAAVAIVLVASALGLPVLHQSCDYYWQHVADNRARFGRLTHDRELQDLFCVLGGWESPRWRIAVPNEGFRQLCIAQGMNPTRLSILPAPIPEPVAATLTLEELAACLGPISFGPPEIRRAGRIEIGEAAWTMRHTVVLIPTKLSRTKRVPQTLLDTVEALARLGVTSPITVIVSGGPYDMETADGLTSIAADLSAVFRTLGNKVANDEIAPVRVLLLGGTPRFPNGGNWAMPDLYPLADLVVVGSVAETDCPAAFEASLAGKPVWIRPWVASYQAVFDAVFSDMVVGVLADKETVLVDPTDTASVRAAAVQNQSVVRKRNASDVFLALFHEALAPPVRTPAWDVAGALFRRIKEAVGNGEAGDMRVICIAGASGSGKSTLSEHLVQIASQHGITCQSISLDDYHSDQPPGQPVAADTPASSHIGLLLDDLKRLQHGEPVVLPRYHHQTPRRTRVLGYADHWVVVEGIFALCEKYEGADGGRYSDLRALSSLNVYLDAGSAALERSLASDIRRRKGPLWTTQRFVARREEAQLMHQSMARPHLVVRLSSDDATSFTIEEAG